MKNKIHFSEIRGIKNKKHKEGHFYKRKDGDYDLVLPYKKDIGFVEGNIIKIYLEKGVTKLKVYEPFKKD